MRTAAIGLAALVFLSGCGVPTQDVPVEVRQTTVPSQLRSGATRQPESSSTAKPTTPTVLVHFVRADRLVGLARDVPSGSLEDRLDGLLAALAAGPSEAEQGQGVTSALPAGLQVRVLTVSGPEVVLELNGETDGTSATENVLAVGQIVLSATSFDAVKQVRLARDGQPVEALLADGALTDHPLSAADFSILRAS